MGVLLNFLTENYLIFVIIAGILVLALIGYIVDATKTDKLKKEYAKNEVEVTDIPVVNVDSKVTLSESVNNATTNSNADVKGESSENPSNITSLEQNTSQKE